MGHNYKAYVPHGITFINMLGNMKHTWRDWKIVPTSRPIFKPPNIKRVEVAIPGADGILDMTESLTGEVHYNNRSGSMEFQVENKNSWYDVYSDILDFIHGQQMKAIFDDEPVYYYTGRFSVNEWKSEQYRSKIVIDYNVEPYKMEMFSSLEDWEWDSFNFESGIIREYKEITIKGTEKVVIYGTRMTVVPIIMASEPMHVSFSGQVYELEAGENEVPEIQIVEGENILTFEGNGMVSIDYRGGRL